MTTACHRLGSLLLALPLALAAVGPGFAATSGWVSTDQSQIRLVSASAAVGTARTVTLGLHVRLEPGWKVYWRSPGDAGFPPIPDWTGSTNLAGAELHWPAPSRFRLFGLETFGYADEVVFPVTATLAEPGVETTLRLALSYAICKDVCIPYEAVLRLELGPGNPAATPFAPLIERYRARVPARANSPALSLIDTAVRGSPGDQRIEIRVRAAEPLLAPDVIVEGPAGFYFAAPRVEASQGGREVLLRVQVTTGKTAKSLAGELLTLTIVDGERALERRVAVPAAE